MIRSSLLPFAFLALAGVVIWLASSGDSDDGGARPSDGAALRGADAGPADTAPLPVVAAPIPGEASPGGSAEPVPQPARSGPPVEARDVHADIATRQRPACMRRLGWPVDDSRGAFVARWFTDKLAADAESFERIGHTGNVGRAEEMRTFNQATQARRLQLLQALGVEAAQTVVDEFCLYQFDPEQGRWHRIDALGQRVPFKHEDDDIWQGFESNNPDWNNHASR